MDAIKVSIVCNTYNQESYVRDALNGFVMQKTDFPFEILVHDDASTDSTAQIIREYAEKYPHLIKPILQTENQYSKKVSISKVFQFSRAQGEYIAFCEGDDYWTDPLKLQKQVDALDSHPEVDICAHRVMTTRDEKKTGMMPAKTENAHFTVEEVIEGGGGFVCTASLMFRKKIFIDEYAFAKMLSIDYIWQMTGALNGGMLYLGDCMGVYRQMAKGSWSSRGRKNGNAVINSWKKIRAVLVVMNEETGFRYAPSIEKQIAMMDLNIMNRSGDLKTLLSAEGRKLLRLQPLKDRPVIILQTIRRSVMKLPPQ